MRNKIYVYNTIYAKLYQILDKREYYTQLRTIIRCKYHILYWVLTFLLKILIHSPLQYICQHSVPHRGLAGQVLSARGVAAGSPTLYELDNGPRSRAHLLVMYLLRRELVMEPGEWHGGGLWIYDTFKKCHLEFIFSVVFGSYSMFGLIKYFGSIDTAWRMVSYDLIMRKTMKFQRQPQDKD